MFRTNGPPLAYAATSVAVAVLVLALAPTYVGRPSTLAADFPDLGGGGKSVLTTVTLGSTVGTHLADPFFAVTLSVTGVSAAKHMTLGAYLNSTPFASFRLAGGSEGYDPTTQTDYEPPAGGGRFLPIAAQLVNFTAFKGWCTAQTPTCNWLSYLPAEENNTTAAVHFATWYHKVLGFVPTDWMFGNEPTAWTHYGKNVTTWSTRDASTPTDADDATMVHNYIAAIRAVFPADQFIGVEAACACDPTFLQNVAAVDGKEVAAMAFHAFPSATGSGANVSQYLGALRGGSNLTSSTSHFASILASACAPCAGLPMQIGAYQAGPAMALSPLSGGYAGAVFLAASVVQALSTNLSSFTVFSSSMLFNATSGTESAQGLLFSRLLANLTMGKDVAVNVRSGTAGGVFAIETSSGTHTSFLLVNTNTSFALNLGIGTTVFPVRTTGSYWTWSPTTLVPTAHRGVTVPGSFTVPAEGILLLNDF